MPTSRPTGFWDLPLELQERIFAYLEPRDKLCAREASWDFEYFVDVQVAVDSWFNLEERDTLLLSFDEFWCTTATEMALTRYENVHLIIAKSIVETQGCERILQVNSWLNVVTHGGERLFKTIEIPGTIRNCACRFGELTRLEGKQIGVRIREIARSQF